MMCDLYKLGKCLCVKCTRRIKLYSVPRYGYRSTGRSTSTTEIGPMILSGLKLLMNI